MEETHIFHETNMNVKNFVKIADKIYEVYLTFEKDFKSKKVIVKKN